MRSRGRATTLMSTGRPRTRPRRLRAPPRPPSPALSSTIPRSRSTTVSTSSRISPPASRPEVTTRSCDELPAQDLQPTLLRPSRRSCIERRHRRGLRPRRLLSIRSLGRAIYETSALEIEAFTRHATTSRRRATGNPVLRRAQRRRQARRHLAQRRALSPRHRVRTGRRGRRLPSRLVGGHDQEDSSMAFAPLVLAIVIGAIVGVYVEAVTSPRSPAFVSPRCRSS